jgi:hypothetical protein
MPIIKDSSFPETITYVRVDSDFKKLGNDSISITSFLRVKKDRLFTKSTEVNNLHICDMVSTDTENGKSFDMIPNREKTVKGRTSIIEHAPRIIMDGEDLYHRVKRPSGEDGLPQLVYQPFTETSLLDPITSGDFIYLNAIATDYVKKAGICSAKKFSEAQKNEGISFFIPEASFEKRYQKSSARIYLLKDLNKLKK